MVSRPIGPTGFVTFGVIPHVALCDFRCACKFDMHEKRLPQAWHINRFSPVCMETCVSKLSRYAKDLSQNSHLNGFIPLCFRS